VPACEECGENFSEKRAELGYKTCLKCGEEDAQKEISKRKLRIAVLCNKSSYQYICSDKDLLTIGKK